jgi:BrnA antitoxin of type II toxin-antitoxin system
VLKFFRSMGPGYQPRINQVLRAFMHAKLMGVLEGDDTLDRFRDQEMIGPDERPEWGYTDRMHAKLKEKRRQRAEGG